MNRFPRIKITNPAAFYDGLRNREGNIIFDFQNGIYGVKLDGGYNIVNFTKKDFEIIEDNNG